MGGFASPPAAANAVERSAGDGTRARRTWRRAMLRGTLAGLALAATALVPAALLLPGLRLPWGMMLGASLVLPLVIGLVPLLLDRDAEPGPADAVAPAELPGSLGIALYALVAVSAPVIGAGAGALFRAGTADSSLVVLGMALAAAVPGAAGARLVRRLDPFTSRRILQSVAAAVGMTVFLLATLWTALWIVMFDPGWI